MESLQKLTILATGRVQGVGFRRFVEKQANLYQVAGWVKNNSDGTVAIEACAKENIIKLFLEAVKKGNFFAKVDNLSIENREIVEEYSKVFEVKF